MGFVLRVKVLTVLSWRLKNKARAVLEMTSLSAGQTLCTWTVSCFSVAVCDTMSRAPHSGKSLLQFVVPEGKSPSWSGCDNRQQARCQEAKSFHL